MRKLTPDEQSLWDKVTETIQPLSRNPDTRVVEPPKVPQQATRITRTTQARVEREPPRAAAKPYRELGRHGLDGHWERRIKSGTIEPDRVLDLHGHTLDQAWDAIDRGLADAIQRGHRVILLITGHARPNEAPVKRGKIRAAVNDWLSVSAHAPNIAAVRGAHRRHGGGGSLYIIMKR